MNMPGTFHHLFCSLGVGRWRKKREENFSYPKSLRSTGTKSFYGILPSSSQRSLWNRKKNLIVFRWKFFNNFSLLLLSLSAIRWGEVRIVELRHREHGPTQGRHLHLHGKQWRRTGCQQSNYAARFVWVDKSEVCKKLMLFIFICNETQIWFCDCFDQLWSS